MKTSLALQRRQGAARAVAALALTVACAAAWAQAPAAAEAQSELAFVSIRTGDAHIYVRRADGKVRAVTSGPGAHTQPTWASNNRLAYTLSEGGESHLMFTDTAGGAAQRVSSGSRNESSPAWSPDGRYLAFFSRSPAGGNTELVLFDSVTQQASVAARNAHDMGPTAPSWSSDGQRLAFQAADAKEPRRNQVFVVDRKDGSLRELSSKLARGASTPNLSPDGSQVLWIADLRERLPVMLTNVDTGVSRELTPESPSFNESPRWSPDGKQIVFVSLRDTLASGRNEVFVMSADGTGIRNISRNDAEDFDAKWSADGQSIVFASLRSGTSLLFEASLSGGDPKPISVHASHDMDHAMRPLPPKTLATAPASATAPAPAQN